MKSSAISSFILAMLISLLMVTAALLMFQPDWGMRFSVACIFLACFLSGFGVNRNPTILLGKDIWRLHKDKRYILYLALAIAFGLALFDRRMERMPLFPESLQWFVLISMLIGATEEFVFRGVIQGEASRWHSTGAIYLSATAFAAYKALLFFHPDTFNQADPWALFYITLPAGILLGYARKASGSLWPPILAHMLFDLILYGDTIKAPWWVWPGI